MLEDGIYCVSGNKGFTIFVIKDGNGCFTGSRETRDKAYFTIRYLIDRYHGMPLVFDKNSQDYFGGI